MVSSKFEGAKISAIVTVVPDIKKKVDDEIDLYGGDVKQIMRIKKTIGLNERYVTDEKTTTADLCEKASEEIFINKHLERSGIDALIFVSQTPDYWSQPFTAAYLHKRLGLSKECAAFDVNLGCSGYVYGLWLAHMMVSCGACRKVLLLVGDTTTKVVNPRDRAAAILFGDAGTATLIEKARHESYFCLHTDGSGFDKIIVPAGGCRTPRTEETSLEKTGDDGNIRSPEDLYMNGAEVFNFSVGSQPPAIKEMLEFSGKELGSIDYIVFHQANRYIITNIVRKLGYPQEKAPSGTVEKYGNQSSASIPSTICDVLGREIEHGSKEVIMSGFGVGYSWAACLTKLEGVYCPEIRFFSGKKDG